MGGLGEGGLPQFNTPILLKPALSPALDLGFHRRDPNVFLPSLCVPRVLSICMYVHVFSHKKPNINHDTSTEDL